MVEPSGLHITLPNMSSAAGMPRCVHAVESAPMHDLVNLLGLFDIWICRNRFGQHFEGDEGWI
jgi:hypothetical protein